MPFSIPVDSWSLAEGQSSDQREALARFWLAAPADCLEQLCRSGFGDATAALIRALSSDTQFTNEQIMFRDAINQKLQSGGLQQPLAPQLLLAVFLFSPIGLMQIVNPDTNLPAWLFSFYQQVYEGDASIGLTESVQTEVRTPDFGDFPSSLGQLIGNRIHLNRILGLSNLYYIDPEDREICGELLEVRRQLSDLILAAQESSLEQIWAGDFGDRYWAMVRSGIQNEPLSPEDENRKQIAAQKLNPNNGGGFGTPGAINSVLIAMLFYTPGTMRIAKAETQLPSWIYPSYQQVFAEALAQNP